MFRIRIRLFTAIFHFVIANHGVRLWQSRRFGRKSTGHSARSLNTYLALALIAKDFTFPALKDVAIEKIDSQQIKKVILNDQKLLYFLISKTFLPKAPKEMPTAYRWAPLIPYLYILK